MIKSVAWSKIIALVIFGCRQQLAKMATLVVRNYFKVEGQTLGGTYAKELTILNIFNKFRFDGRYAKHGIKMTMKI